MPRSQSPENCKKTQLSVSDPLEFPSVAVQADVASNLIPFPEAGQSLCA
jgi:hypothetical protein